MVKKIICVALCICLLMPALCACGSKSKIDEEEAAKIADSYIADFTSGNYEAMVKNYKQTDSVASQLSESVLKSAWEDTVVAKCGNYVSLTRTDSSVQSGLLYFLYDVSCEKAIAQIMVAIDNEGKISGLNIYGIKALSEYSFQDVNATEVVFSASDGLSVNGTLVKPLDAVENAPIAIIVAGSGPNDRYGTVNQINHPYADIATALAQNGICTLIYDKRTYTYASDATQAEKMKDVTIEYEVVYDAVGAYNYAKTIEGVAANKIFFIGHSLGGYCLPLIDKALSDENPAGYIFLSAPSSHMEDLMKYQIKYLSEVDGTVSDEEKQAIENYDAAYDRIKSLTQDNKDEYTAAELMNAPAAYWLSMKDYDAVAAAGNIDSPKLFLNGTADYQVPLSEFETYKNALGASELCTFKTLDNLNHLLLLSDGSMSPAEYYNPGTVESIATDEIVGFINAER